MRDEFTTFWDEHHFLAQNIPHKWYSKQGWYWPAWWCWLFSGNYDSGNGSGWYPGLGAMINRYYEEEWWEAGYTIWHWISYPTKRGLASERKKLYVQPHGLW
jgi:hypothetical protein